MRRSDPLTEVLNNEVTPYSFKGSDLRKSRGPIHRIQFSFELMSKVLAFISHFHTLHRRYHSVSTHGSLPWVHHFDAGSIITIDTMLSDADEFEGGEFQTLETDGTMKSYAFERGDVLIFLSHKYHCVQRVRSGSRRVLVIELWDGAERICAHRCERRFGVCELENVCTPVKL
jgi:hypothetical protein